MTVMRMNILRLEGIRHFFSFELLFVLFLFAGLYKADPRLEWVPVDLTALFFVLSIISGLVIVARKGLVFNRKAFILLLLYIAFAGFVLLSYLWTPGKIYSTQKMLYIWTLVLWSLTAPALIISVDPARFKRLGIIYLILSIIVLIEAITQYLVAGGGFIRVFGSNYLAMGRVIGLAFLVVVAYFIFWTQSKSEKFFALAIAGLYLWLMLIGGGRGPFLAAILSALIPFAFALHVSLGRQTIKLRRYAVPMLIIVIVAILLFSYFVNTGQMTQTYSRLLVLTQTGMGDSAGARLQHYGNAIEYWKHAPVLGYGIGSWPVINGGVDMRGYPHNIILEILVELGILGVFIFMLFIFYAFSMLAPLKSVGDHPIRILLIMLTVYMLFNSMVSGDISDNRLLFVCIGLMPVARSLGEK
jgi:O-antigen ligase